MRANATEIVLRLGDEARAGKTRADIYDGTTVGEALKRHGLAEHWLPEEASTFPSDYRDPDGYWVAQNFYIITAAFNTNLVPSGREPKNWDDLLDRKYRGQIAWAGSASVSAGAGFVGIVLKQLGNEKGRAYLGKLARQKIAAIDAAARVVVDQLIAGEYALGLQIFPEHADESAAKGAPVKWIAMEPGMSAIVSTTGIVKSPPHPNAARLFLALYDFRGRPENLSRCLLQPRKPEGVAPRCRSRTRPQPLDLLDPCRGGRRYAAVDEDL